MVDFVHQLSFLQNKKTPEKSDALLININLAKNVLYFYIIIMVKFCQ
nr:MAG TPA: hypothetical protein [Caudoviricetes sp.]